jgi:hypothetical protein
MLEALLGSGIAVLGAWIAYMVRTEHRLTRLETKMDMLLNHNNIDPKSCQTKKRKGTK